MQTESSLFRVKTNLEIIDSYTRKKIGDMSIGLLKENECPPIEFEVLK